MSLIHLVLGALATLLAGLVYYKGKAAKATGERQQLRDQLRLIDTKKELERNTQEVADAEKTRLEAIAAYRDMPTWRPNDPPEPRGD